MIPIENIFEHFIVHLGSGKRALLEVIARRSKGLSRGQILLDGRPLTQAMFNQCCAYVGHRADLIPSLSVQQTLHYAANLSIGSEVSGYVKDSRVRQVLADLALSQVARHSVQALTEGEYRRLVIGTQLVKDPGTRYTLDTFYVKFYIKKINNKHKRQT